MSSKDNLSKKSETIKKIKKAFLWSAVVILIGEFVFGAIEILIGGISSPILARLQATLLLAAIVLFVGVNNLKRIEDDNVAVRGFAWVSFVTNILWLVIAVLLIWEIVPVVEYRTSYRVSVGTMSVLSKVMVVAISLASSGFFISNVLAIKETVKQVKPLKITAVVCELYNCVFAIIVVLAGYESFMKDWSRWAALSGLAGLAFVITALAALIISNSNKKKETSEKAAISEEKMQATIQEMVEKEVQARLAAEKKKAELESMPPLQSDDMPPTVSRDNEVKINTREDSKQDDDNSPES